MSLPNKLPPDLLEFSERMPSIIWNVFIAGISVIIGLIAKAIITRVLKYYEKKADYKIYSFFQSFIIHLGIPFTYFIPLFFTKHCIAAHADG